MESKGYNKLVTVTKTETDSQIQRAKEQLQLGERGGSHRSRRVRGTNYQTPRYRERMSSYSRERGGAVTEVGE